MFTTKQAVRSLRKSNPGRRVTEDLVRSALRRELLSPPTLAAGRYLWSDRDLQALAVALGLAAPSRTDDAEGRGA